MIDVHSVVRRLIQPLAQRMRNMIGRAVISAVSDSGNLQTLRVQILEGENLDDVERFSEYGFTSSPPANSQGVVVFLNGNRSDGVVVATENRAFRFKTLANGEVCIYTDLDKGSDHRIHLKSDRSIEVFGSTVTVNADTVNLGGTGGQSLVLADFITKFNAHFHPTAPTGPTSTPAAPVFGSVTTKTKAL